MSKISQDFINNLGSLYEEIHVKDQDFLNEESEYYDEEATELVEDILSSVSLSMIYEGYSATAVISFLADSSEEEIIEKYLNFDESVLNESTVSEEYIEEQLEILNEFVGALFRVGKALAKGAKYAKGAKGAAPLTRLASGLKSAGTATERIAKQGPKASSVVRSTLSKGVQKVKDVAKGAKTALTGPTAKKVALGAAGLGAAGLAGGVGGYFGAKLAGAGAGSGKDSGVQGAPKPSPSTDSSKWNASAALGGKAAFSAGGGAAKMKQNPNMTAADVQKQGMINIRNKPATAPSTSSGSGAPSSSSGSSGSGRPSPSPAKPKADQKASGDSNLTPMQQWAKANPTLAAKVKPGQSGYGEISATRDKPGTSEKKDQTPTIGKPEAKIDTSSVEADIKKEQERLKKKAAETASTTKEAYEIVLEYLIDTEQVDTLEEAHYVMLEMDAETIGDIVENYEDCLLAEEVEEWVNALVDEGYDLSDYTWDEIIEYYMTEARIDDDKTDDEKRTARSERGTIGYMHPFTKKTKKKRGEKTLSSTGKYSQMLHDKKQAQRERDGDEQRRRDRDAMSRGTWDKD
jgi:hypothetical protein